MTRQQHTRERTYVRTYVRSDPHTFLADPVQDFVVNAISDPDIGSPKICQPYQRRSTVIFFFVPSAIIKKKDLFMTKKLTADLGTKQ